MRLRLLPIALLVLLAQGATASPPGTDLYCDPLPQGALARLGTLRFRSRPLPSDAILSPDGKTAAFSDEAGAIQILEVPHGTPLQRLTGPGHNPVFSHSGRLLAAETADGEIRVWSLDTGRQKVLLKQEGAVLSAPGFSANDRFLVGRTSKTNKQVSVWNLETATHVGDCRGPENADSSLSDRCRGVLSPDGALVACWNASLVLHSDGPSTRAVIVWNVATGKESFRIQARERVIGAAAWSPDGQRLAVVSGAGTLQLFDARTGKQVGKDFEASFADIPLCFSNMPLYGASYVAFFPDGHKVAIVGSGPKIAIWDMATRKRLEPGCPGCEFRGICFKSDTLLACGVWGHALIVWELYTGKVLPLPQGHRSAVASLGFTGKEHRLFSTAGVAETIAWDILTAKGVFAPGTDEPTEADLLEPHIRRIQGSPSRLFGSLQLSPDAQCVVEGGGLRPVSRMEVREPATRKFLHGLDLQGLSLRTGFSVGRQVAVTLTDVAAARDGDAFARTGTAALWETDTGKVVRRWEIPSGMMDAVVVPPDRTLAFGLIVPLSTDSAKQDDVSLDPQESLLCWDTTTGAKRWEKVVKRADSSMLETLAFACGLDGQLVAPDPEGGLSFWDMETGEPAKQLAAEQGWHYTAAAFSADGRSLALGLVHEREPRARVRIVELATGRTRAEFTGHRGAIQVLAFSPDGRLLASGSEDTTILLWDLAGDGRQPRERPLSAADAEKLWTDLDSPDAGLAYRAGLRLANSPREAVALLKRRLHPAQPIKEPPLPLQKTLRGTRAVEALERIDTPDARQLLQALATGYPQGRLTQEAKRSLAHLAIAKPPRVP